MSNYPVIGALIGTGFAFGWAVAGSLHLGALPWRRFALGASLVVSLLLAGALLQHARPPRVPAAASAHFDGRSYGIAVAFDSLAIPLAAVACRRSARADLLVPSIAGIVGLHFFGLAHALGSAGAVFVWVASAMSALALTALCCARPAHAAAWSAGVGLGCAGILWASAWSVLW